ncbi:MAG: TonB-dependent receptor [Burkholderiaceae bacterium]|nr:TonB-dependent receptor [Burkholderiaceae bacterium]
MRNTIKTYPVIVALSAATLQLSVAGAQESAERAPVDGKKTEPANVEEVESGAGRNRVLAPVDTIVITGTSLPRRKFDAAYANSTISEPQIEIFAPLSAVDLFGKLAGFGSEPSGGEGGNNVNVRGLPSSSFRFIPVLQDGLPVFQEAQEDFLNADELTRTDLMTDRVEAVRGGTSPIYASNAPGATINLISKKGSRERQGTLRATWGDYGLARFDAQWSGPVADDLLLSMGGFYRVDDGLRPTGFTADKGGQFRINVTRLIPGGEVTLYANRLDDKTAFYLPIPLADPRNPSVSLAHLIDPREGTLASSDFRHVRLRTLNGTPGGTTLDEDLSEGIHSKITTVGGGIDRKFGDGWTVSDKARYTTGSVKFNALFSLTPPEDAAAFLGGQLGRAQAGFGPGLDRLAYVLANTRDPSGARILFDPAATQGLVTQGGWWGVNSRISNFMNDFRLTKSLSGVGPGGHEVTGGIYFSHYTFRQSRLFNTILLETRSRPRALDVLAFDSAGNALGSVTENGFLDYGDNTDLGGRVEGRLWAVYAGDDWKLSDRTTLDVGLRHQRTRQRGYAIGRATQNLGNPQTLADDNVGGPSGIVDNRSEQLSGTAWTLGVNHDFSSRFGAFARYTSSFRTPTFGNIYTGDTQAPAVNSKVKEIEIGTKHRYRNFSAFLTAFWNRFNPLVISTLTVDAGGNLVSTNFISDTENYGVELEGSWRPNPRFELFGNMTLQNPRYKNLSALGSGPPISGVEGNQVRRIPKILASITPTLNFTAFGHTGKAYATISHQGQKFVDSNNTTKLPGYTTLDAGLIYNWSPNLRFQLMGSNLTNKIGLTEGNPRTDSIAGQGTSTAIYARPIFGRAIRASLTYSW